MDARDSAEPTHASTRRRRTFRRLGIAGGIICAPIIVGLIAVHTPPARRYLIDQVVALLSREQIEFSTDQLGYNVLNASVNLRNVRVRSTTWPDAPAFATIGRLRLNLSLLQLLRGRYVVQSGTIEDVDVHYVVDEQGRNNLPRPPADPNAPHKPLDYLVSSLSITRAQVRYENRAEQIDAQLPLSSVEVSGNDLTNRHEIQFEAAGGHVRAQDREAAIDRAAGTIDLGEDDVAIERVEVESVGSRADVAGTIKTFDAPVADLTVKSSIDASRVAPLAGVEEPVGGNVTINATAKGPLSTPAIDAHVSGSALQFRDLRDVQLDADAAYDLATRQANISSLQVRGPWGGVSGTGHIATDRGEQSRIQGDINNVDAGAIMRALRLPYVAATRVNGKLQAEWPGLEYLQAKGTADATLSPTASEMSRSAMPVGGRVVAQGKRRAHRCAARASRRAWWRSQRHRRRHERSPARRHHQSDIGRRRAADVVDRSIHRTATRVAVADAGQRRRRDRRATRRNRERTNSDHRDQRSVAQGWHGGRRRPERRGVVRATRAHRQPSRHHLATGTCAR